MSTILLMQNIILIGMKHCGKSTLSRKISLYYQMNCLEIDKLIEEKHAQEKDETISFRDIAQKYGIDYFRNLETKILQDIADKNLTHTIIDTGGGAPLNPKNQEILKKLGVVTFLDVDEELNLKWILERGIPAFFKYPNDPKKSFDELIAERKPKYQALADITLPIKSNEFDEHLNNFIKLYENYLGKGK